MFKKSGVWNKAQQARKHTIRAMVMTDSDSYAF